ncbi:hypothetical protein CVT26_010031 [Gymnopilus dilepis]|uniref:HhH-GPD domain-containing protein n=1 Tax=Gymnopilus dilepis TaxID=231916 RepID=A0A409Y709_9AGAR|nr:hypothetical protein CVT26_010031 [Gymnopilus dilepis]
MQKKNDGQSLLNGYGVDTLVASHFFGTRKGERPSDNANQANEGLTDTTSEDHSVNDNSLSGHRLCSSSASASISRSPTFSKLSRQQIADDPWKLLIAVTLLNKTCGKLAVPAFWDIIAKWPTPLDLAQADESELISAIRHLGTQNIRAKRLIALSKSYMQDPPSAYDLRHSSKVLNSPRRSSRFFLSTKATQYPPTSISHLPGTGPYALDSYRIFSSECEDPTSEEWKRVLPADKELIRFLRWKWACMEGMEWTPTQGVIRAATEKYLCKLVMELESTMDENNVG